MLDRLDVSGKFANYTPEELLKIDPKPEEMPDYIEALRAVIVKLINLRKFLGHLTEDGWQRPKDE